MKKKNTKYFFWTSVGIWIISAWIFFFNAFIDTIQKLGVDLTVNTIRIIALVIMLTSNAYILWLIIDRGKIPIK